MKRQLINIAFITLAFCTTNAIADGHAGKIKSYLAGNSEWLKAPELIAAINQQNNDHSGLSEADIEKLDMQWRTEKKAGGGDLMNSKMGNELSAFLKEVRSETGDLVVEIFVMDNKGLNVGQTDPTGDYMQGDEDKWQKTYQAGPGAVFVDEVEEDGGKNVSQASITVVDESGDAIGAATVVFDVAKL